MDGASIFRSRCWRLIAPVLLITSVVCAACTPYLGTTYKSYLRHVRENNDPNIRYVAYAKLGSRSLYESPAEKGEAVRLLIAKFEEGREPIAVRAAIIRSLGNLGDQRARAVVLKAANDNDNAIIRVEACRALGKVGLPEDATLLARIMMVDKLEDCRIAAIESMGTLKAEDPRRYQILLEGMDHDDPAIRLECLRALRTLTHQDLGVDPAAWRRELEPKIAALKTAAETPTAPAQAAAARDQKPK